MNIKLAAALCLMSSISISSSQETVDAAWQRGLAGGTLVEGSTSPDRKHALFELNKWDGPAETTATAIGLVRTDRSKVLIIIGSRTKWMTDRDVTSFLAFKWNEDSTMLATHDSGAKHSKVHLYRISGPEAATELAVPDLLGIAAMRQGITVSAVSSSGQVPVRWKSSQIIEVAVGLTTSKGKSTTVLSLQVDAEGKMSVQ